MTTRDRPRNNDARKLAGVEQKKRDKRAKTPRAKVDRARKALEREILKGVSPELKSVFKRFKEGVTPETLLGVLGMELVRLQRSLGDEAPDYRYGAQLQKILDQIRRTILMNQESAFIPDRVILTIDAPEDHEDYSDEPEFE